MTLKEAEKRIAALEAQVAMLAAQVAQQPYLMVPSNPFPQYPSPWWTYPSTRYLTTSGASDRITVTYGTATTTSASNVTYLKPGDDDEPPEAVGAKPA